MPGGDTVAVLALGDLLGPAAVDGDVGHLIAVDDLKGRSAILVANADKAEASTASGQAGPQVLDDRLGLTAVPKPSAADEL